MGIIAARILAISNFPATYNEIVLSASECEAVIALFRSEFDSGKWVMCGEAETSDWSSEEVRKWLMSVGIQGDVNVVWIGLHEGIRLDYSKFVEFYDDLWFPASDDVLVVTLDRVASLEISHEELFRWAKHTARDA